MNYFARTVVPLLVLSDITIIQCMEQTEIKQLSNTLMPNTPSTHFSTPVSANPAATVSPDEETGITCSSSSTAYLWEVQTHKITSQLTGHIGTIISTLLSPDRKTLFTVSDDGTAHLWGPSTRSLFYTLNKHTEHTGHIISEQLVSPQLSPNGEALITNFNDGTASLWNSSTGRLICALTRYTGRIISGLFSSDGKALITNSDDGTAYLWNPSTGGLICTLKGHTGHIIAGLLSSDGRTLFARSHDGTAYLWNVLTRQLICTLTGYTGIIISEFFSPDEKTLFTLSHDGTAYLQDALTGKVIYQLTGHTGLIISGFLSPDGKTLLTESNNGTASLWNSSTGQLICPLTGHTGHIISGFFSSDEKTLITDSNDGTAYLWNSSTGQLICSLKGHTGILISGFFSSDEKTLITNSNDGTAYLWNSSTGQLICTLKGHTGHIISGLVSPDGKTLFTLSHDGTAYLQDALTGKVIYQLTGHTGLIISGFLSPDGKTLLTESNDGTAYLWNSSTGQLICPLTGYTGTLISGFFSSDEKTLITNSNDGTAYLWNSLTGQLICPLTGHTGHIIAGLFSPDGKVLIALSDDGTAYLWEPLAGQLICPLIGHTGTLISGLVSPDGKTLFTRSHDGTAYLQDALTGKVIYQLTGHTGLVISGLFSSDGKALITNSDGGTAYLREVSTGKLLAAFPQQEQPDSLVTCSQESVNLKRSRSTQEDKTDRESGSDETSSESEQKKRKIDTTYQNSCNNTKSDGMVDDTHEIVQKTTSGTGQSDLAYIADRVAKYYNCTLLEICSQKLDKNLTVPRYVAMHFMRKNTNYSLKDIAVFCGRKDPSSTGDALNKIKKMAEKDEAFRNELESINTLLFTRSNNSTAYLGEPSTEKPLGAYKEHVQPDHLVTCSQESVNLKRSRSTQEDKTDRESGSDETSSESEQKKRKIDTTYQNSCNNTKSDSMVDDTHEIVQKTTSGIGQSDLAYIADRVAKYYNCTLLEICSQKRDKNLILPRYVAMHFMRKNTNYSLKDIAVFCGRKDASSTDDALNKIKKMVEKDKAFRAKLESIDTLLFTRSNDGTAYLVEPSTGKPLGAYKEHAQPEHLVTGSQEPVNLKRSCSTQEDETDRESGSDEIISEPEQKKRKIDTTYQNSCNNTKSDCMVDDTHEIVQKTTSGIGQSDLAYIASRVAKYYNFTLSELCSQKLRKDLTVARDVAKHFMRKHTDHFLKDIAVFCGRNSKNHRSVKEALNRVKKRAEKDKAFHDELESINTLLFTRSNDGTAYLGELSTGKPLGAYKEYTQPDPLVTGSQEPVNLKRSRSTQESDETSSEPKQKKRKIDTTYQNSCNNTKSDGMVDDTHEIVQKTTSGTGQSDLAYIADRVAKYYNCTLLEICSQKLDKNLTVPRYVAMHFMRKNTNYSLKDIAVFCGRKDPSSTNNALNSIKKMAEKDEAFRDELESINQDLHNNTKLD